MNPDHPDVLPTDVEDRRAWRRHWLPGIAAKDLRELLAGHPLTYRLAEEDVDRLLAFYVHEEIEREPFAKYGTRDRLHFFLNEVHRIDVRLRPGGIGLLRDRLAGYSVQIRWEQVGRTKDRRPNLEPRTIRVIGDAGLGMSLPRLSRYMAAFFLKGMSAPGQRTFTRRVPQRARPAPGRPPDMTFYLRLVEEAEELLRAGERAPARVLAERYTENASTMRSWLKRARDYRRRADAAGEKEGGSG